MESVVLRGQQMNYAGYTSIRDFRVWSWKSGYGNDGDVGEDDDGFSIVRQGSRTVRTPFSEQMSRVQGIDRPSAELLELVRVQLDMLVSLLESRVRDAFAQMDMGVRCAMYCRTPSSITSRTLKLQLVATSDDAWDAPDNSTMFANEFIIGDDVSADAEEAWVVNQPMIVLPDNGGLILPLTHKSFLVGLLLVERTLPNLKNAMLPPVHDVFGPAEIGIIKQSGVALSMSCAMDLRAVMERAGSRMQNERLQGLLSQASKPLSTLKTLGRMLQPRLSKGEPERDMTDGMIAQGQYLGDLVSQIQSVINMPDLPASMKQLSPGETRRDASSSNFQNATQERPQGTMRKVHMRPKMDGPSYPALPSSSIGADNWDSLSSVEEDDDFVDDRSGMEQSLDASTRNEDLSTATSVGQIMKPILDAASHFSRIKGSTLTVQDVDGIVYGDTRLCAHFSTAKHVFGALLDGTLSQVSRGDAIEVRIESHEWEQRPGMMIIISLSLDHNTENKRQGGVVFHLGIELEALQDDVKDMGGWLHLYRDGPSTVHAAVDKDTLCLLWLPTLT